MLLFVLDKVSSVPPLYWIRPKCITLYNGLLRLGNTVSHFINNILALS